MHPSMLTEYEAAIARGLGEKASKREAFVLTYRITDNAGSYRSREQVIKTAANELRHYRVASPTDAARRWVDDHDFMRRHTGETAGSIARQIVDQCSSLWFTRPA